MADGDTTTTTTTTTTPPWHDGIDASLIGWAQNKGYKLESPKDAFSAAAKQAFEAEKHFSASPDQLIKLPKDAADTAGWDSVFQRLNVPKEAKDYDLSSIKLGGNDLDPALADALRAGMLKGRVPKEAAPEVAKTVVKAMEDAEAQKATVFNAKLTEEKAKLTKDWGTNYDFNHLKAMEGARKLGITPDAVKALEGQIGFAAVMEAMRKIGQGTSEDAFVEGNRGPGGNPTTRDGAISKKAETMADKDWVKRYLAGGVKERQEMDALNMMIDGEAA